jgi:GT2 family glycosyltransferase
MKNEMLFELLQSGDEAIGFLCENLNTDVADTCVLVSGSLGELYENIASYVEANKIAQQHRGREAALNSAIAARKLSTYCSDGDFEKAAFLMTYELMPLHIFLSNELDVWYAIYPDMEKLHERRDREFKALTEYLPDHKNALEAEYDYDVSVMMLCYNKVQFTKIALESLLKYTDFDKYRVEIIIVNNGSDDNGETSAYIGGLNDPRIKAVDLKYPLGYNGQSLGPPAAGGRYFVELHTDVVATENWLNNLMECIGSDPNIGAAVAVCNESSNNQTISINYANPIKNDTELHRFAGNYNKSDPSMWEDRARIIPISGYITPTILYRHLLRDPWLYYGQFTDDDMSVFLRRSGFRQVLAKDTFLHHYGSQTSSTDIAKNDSISIMRKRFYEKWGVDAWCSAEFNPAVVHYISKQKLAGSESFLFIDPYFGTTPMYVFNEFKAQKKDIGETTAIVSDSRYTADAVYYDKVLIGDLIELLEQSHNKYDYIVFHPGIEEYIDRDFPGLLNVLRSACKPGAKVLFTLSNPGYYMKLLELAGGTVTNNSNEQWKGIRFIDPEYISSTAAEHGFRCTAANIRGPQIEAHKQVIQHLKALATDKNKAEAMTCMSFFYELREG